MNNPYVQALIDSLKKKIEVLELIHVKDEEQYVLAGTVPFPTEAFDKNSDEKGVLIYKLNKLDEGFGLVYAPEAYTDVKGQLTSDYQDVLEKEWVSALKKKYPVVVDKRVLKKLK